MRGSIRTLVGFLIVFGSVGGLDNDQSMVMCLAAAVVGMVLMASGVRAMNRP